MIFCNRIIADTIALLFHNKNIFVNYDTTMLRKYIHLLYRFVCIEYIKYIGTKKNCKKTLFSILDSQEGRGMHVTLLNVFLLRRPTADLARPRKINNYLKVWKDKPLDN